MNPLVSPAWVAARLHEPSLTLLDATLPPVGVVPRVDTHARYLEAHLPGALVFDIEALSDRETTLPHMLPTPEAFAAAMGQLGVASDATIVVYEQGDVFSAPRAWWMLRTLGAREVYLLDGGLRAWRESGLPVEQGAASRAPATFQAQPVAGAVTDFATLQRELAAGHQVLDARSAGRFTGAAPEPRAGLPSGHMPGAINLPYTALTAGNRMRSPEELGQAFAERGVHLAEPVITSCGSGVTAAVLALGLEILGAPAASLYDGSWAEYAQHSEAVIAKDG